jgi:MarR family transcriptional regulator, negative regulator of the multidrug operon emrRAB
MQGRVENLLGAFAISLADQVQDAAEATVGRGPSAPAALLALLRRPHQSIESLRAPLQLSHSATVRLVDRLEEDGLVSRRAAVDGRAVDLVLTAKGRRRALRVQERRRAVLTRAMAGLSGIDRRQLETLLVRLLRNQGIQREDPSPVCRLCEVAVCPVRRCPIPGGR